MSLERFDQTVVQELERDLREALAVEPSADFERRVRARIENAPRRFEWRTVLAMAAAVVIVVAVAWQILSKPAATPRDLGTAARAGVDVPLPPTVIEPRVPDNKTAGTPGRRRPPSVAISEPEVIVPADQALALARLLELSRSGAVDEEKLQPLAAAAGPARLKVEPLVVAPIPLREIAIDDGAARGGAERE